MATTTEGVAVLFALLPNGISHADVFKESEDPDRDPWDRADRMRAAYGDDFPGAIYSIGGNDRARDLAAARRMNQMGFDGYTADDARNLREGSAHD